MQVVVNKTRAERTAKFFATLKAKKAAPGACPRCGRPNDSGYKKCAHCRAMQQAYRRRHKYEYVTVEVAAMDAMTRRVEALERRYESMKSTWRMRWNNGYRAGRRKVIAEIENNKSAWDVLYAGGFYKDSAKNIEELQQMSHRWDDRRQA